MAQKIKRWPGLNILVVAGGIFGLAACNSGAQFGSQGKSFNISGNKKSDGDAIPGNPQANPENDPKASGKDPGDVAGVSDPLPGQVSGGGENPLGTAGANGDEDGDIDGQDGAQNSPGEGSVEGVSGSPSPNTEPPKTVTEVLDLCKSGVKGSLEHLIAFPDPGKVCDWGVDGNGMPKNGEIMARREQLLPIQIVPGNAVLCSMAFEFPEQDMLYDDEIYLTVNNFMLMGSMDYTTNLTKDGDFPVYDWTKIKGNPYNHNLYPKFCAGMANGLSSCVIPPTQTRGKMQLQFSDSLIAQLYLKSAAKPVYDFQWVTLGDNDGADCRHSGFTFKAKVTFASPAQ